MQTANLDGETNLKIRMSPKSLPYFSDDTMLNKLSGTMECAAPNKFLEDFNSRWKAAGSDSFVRRLAALAWLAAGVILTFVFRSVRRHQICFHVGASFATQPLCMV